MIITSALRLEWQEAVVSIRIWLTCHTERGTAITVRQAVEKWLVSEDLSPEFPIVELVLKLK